MERDGRWLAVADFMGEPDIGTGHEPSEAVRNALAAVGEPYATEMAASDVLELGDRHTQLEP